MAPTLVLAKQHYDEMTKMMGPDGFAILTGETRAEGASGNPGWTGGWVHQYTHWHQPPILSQELNFHNLVLTIVDEEHRFGTEQKALLASFDKAGAHHLSMTATPIPRSYASSIYGGCLDIIPIQTMPKGRKPIITSVESNRKDVYRKLLDQVKDGHQAYVVCPSSRTLRASDVRMFCL